MNATVTSKELINDKCINLSYDNAFIYAQADTYAGGTTINYIEIVLKRGAVYPIVLGYTGRGGTISIAYEIENKILSFNGNIASGNWKICQIEIPQEHLPDTTRSIV